MKHLWLQNLVFHLHSILTLLQSLFPCLHCLILPLTIHLVVLLNCNNLHKNYHKELCAMPKKYLSEIELKMQLQVLGV